MLRAGVTQQRTDPELCEKLVSESLSTMQWLRAKGMDVRELARDKRIVFTVRSVCVDYLRPARLSDTVYASVVVRWVGRASIDLSQVIRRDHETLCDGTVRLACVDVDSMRPRGIPKVLASAIRHDTKK